MWCVPTSLTRITASSLEHPVCHQILIHLLYSCLLGFTWLNRDAHLDLLKTIIHSISKQNFPSLSAPYRFIQIFITKKTLNWTPQYNQAVRKTRRGTAPGTRQAAETAVFYSVQAKKPMISYWLQKGDLPQHSTGHLDSLQHWCSFRNFQISNYIGFCAHYIVSLSHSQGKNEPT